MSWVANVTALMLSIFVGEQLRTLRRFRAIAAPFSIQVADADGIAPAATRIVLVGFEPEKCVGGPHWVISGPRHRASECQLYPRKQTSLTAVVMSAKCHK